MYRYGSVLVTLVTLAVLGGLVQGRYDGAPAEACEDMLPRHNIGPQETPAPYSLTFETDEEGNYLGTLNGADFNGFFIQVRDAEDKPIGMFEIIDDKSKLRPCCSSADGITNVLRDVQNSVSFKWSPDGADIDGARFVATVTASFDTFWVGLQSEPLRLESSTESEPMYTP